MFHPRNFRNGKIHDFFSVSLIDPPFPLIEKATLDPTSGTWEENWIGPSACHTLVKIVPSRIKKISINEILIFEFLKNLLKQVNLYMKIANSFSKDNKN